MLIREFLCKRRKFQTKYGFNRNRIRYNNQKNFKDLKVVKVTMLNKYLKYM